MDVYSEHVLCDSLDSQNQCQSNHEDKEGAYDKKVVAHNVYTNKYV